MKSKMVALPKTALSQKLSLGFSYVRALHYTLQGALLPLVDKVVNGESERTFGKFRDHLKQALPKVQALFEKDHANAVAGFYPGQLTGEELLSSVVADYKRLPFLIADALRAHRQRDAKSHSEFDAQAEEFLKSTPEYYRRNFHFQNSGYLSDSSAELYEQQVEVLFSGTAQTMRRQILVPMKNHFGGSQGEGLKILEIACGTGALTKWLAVAFPQAQIVALDLSPHYLKKAQQNLRGLKNVSFIQGLAEDLDFKTKSFDAVVSCYLFHELPLEVRKRVITEKWRVLKETGFFGIVDSIQIGDDPDLEWALQQFPIDFHEPFYKNYIQNDLQKLLQESTSVKGKTEIHFLSKALFAKKPKDRRT